MTVIHKLKTIGNIKTHSYIKRSILQLVFHIADQMTHFLIPKEKQEVFSLVYATVHSLLSSSADLHRRHSSALDSAEKILHFSDGKNKLCPHTCIL